MASKARKHMLRKHDQASNLIDNIQNHLLDIIGTLLEGRSLEELMSDLSDENADLTKWRYLPKMLPYINLMYALDELKESISRARNTF